MFEQPFTKENLDQYLKELAKEFRKINGKNMPADIILIGGASVVINYGFREMTYDMDAVINAASSKDDAYPREQQPYGSLRCQAPLQVLLCRNIRRLSQRGELHCIPQQ